MTQSKVNFGRHAGQCNICKHEQLDQIEADIIAWRSPTAIAATYGFDRSSVYRHIEATNLSERRSKNIKAALEHILEKSGDVDVTATAVVAAVQAYAKINGAGQWIDRTEQLNLNEVFNQMSRDELDSYAKGGPLPPRFGVAQAYSSASNEEAQSE